jgi:hypothetical protein
MGTLSLALFVIPDEETIMNLKVKLIATAILVITSAYAFAARVESEDAQVYGTKANSMRQVVGAVSTPDAENAISVNHW